MSEVKAECVVINKTDLPLCCPRPEDAVWNQHPRVYLAIEPGETIACPYCGTQYQLKG